jgi:predicted N-acetyltransferase YhbS
MQTVERLPLRHAIGDGLLLRTPAGQDDVERVAAFNEGIHGAGLDRLTKALLQAFPGMEAKDLVFVEDENTGAVISSLCLIPWRLRYGAAAVQVGEMGIVGTDEGYRKRGLVRLQVEYFRRRLAQRGCVLSLIQGIPFYYRQFGYTYALPLEGGVRVDGRRLPAAAGPAFTFRRAGEDDLPLLAALYEQGTRDLAVCALRDEATWRYILGPMQHSGLPAEWWLVEAAGEEGGGRTEHGAAGYLRMPQHHFGDELAVYEASTLSYDAALATLHQLQAWAAERSLPGVRLNLPDSALLVRLARSLGGHDLGRYAWQVAMPDPAAFLTAIVPELERRLAAAPQLAGWSGDVPINLYRSGAVLHVECGRIAVCAVEGAAGGEINFPPDAFTPVALGWRSLGEVIRLFPDVHVEGRLRPVFDALFPPLESFIYSAV